MLSRPAKKKDIKKSGTRFEYRVRDLLEDRGWKVVRSAGSHTCADLVGLKPHKQTLVVQCKAMTIPALSSDEISQLVQVQKWGHRVLVIGRDDFSHAYRFYLVNPDGHLELTGEPEWL